MNAPVQAPIVKPEKQSLEAVEHVDSHHGPMDDTVKQMNIPSDLDAFGAQRKKTDPAEIRLVRKLDLWLMVSCFGQS